MMMKVFNFNININVLLIMINCKCIKAGPFQSKCILNGDDGDPDETVEHEDNFGNDNE